jgi:hypothetical protein
VGADPYGDTLIAQLSEPVHDTSTGNTIDGQVISAVYKNSLGTLDFFYQFEFDSLTTTSIFSTSMQSFTNIPGVMIAQTQDKIGGPAGLFFTPTDTGDFALAGRPSVDGNSIDTVLSPGVDHNNSTYIFIARTGALTYEDIGSVAIIGGGIATNSDPGTTFAPIGIPSAPEPGSLELVTIAAALAVGVLGNRMPSVRSRPGGSLMQL